MTVTAPSPQRAGELRAAAALERLPAGTIDLGSTYLRRAALRHPAAGAVDATADAVAGRLVQPLLLVEDWPDPTDPLPVGQGAVHADLIDEDQEAFARLRTTFEGASDPERLAAEAQAWRLPVTPYRTAPMAVPSRRSGPSHPRDPADGPIDGRPSADRSLEDRLVVDLSALWAGPLATALLARLGVRVVKIDPDCRPDGFREHPVLYEHLNRAKDIVDLDLRRDPDRRRFEALVAEADLVIDSFSRRVMANLGYGPDRLRALNPGISSLSIVAFPLGTAEADWISYGPGVHATSGLGAEPTADGLGTRFRAAPIAYPDAIAGMAAFAVAVELLAGTGDPGAAPPPGGGPHREISLAGAIAPLVSDHHRSTAEPDRA